VDNRSIIPVWFAVAANIFVAAATFAVHRWRPLAMRPLGTRPGSHRSAFFWHSLRPDWLGGFPGLRTHARLTHAYVAATSSTLLSWVSCCWSLSPHTSHKRPAGVQRLC